MIFCVRLLKFISSVWFETVAGHCQLPVVWAKVEKNIFFNLKVSEKKESEDKWDFEQKTDKQSKLEENNNQTFYLPS